MCVDFERHFFLCFRGTDDSTVFVLFESFFPPIVAVSIVITRKLFLILLRRLERTSIFRVSNQRGASKERVVSHEEKKIAKDTVASP